MKEVMHPPLDVGTTFYQWQHVPAGNHRVKMDWVKFTVRAVVDREKVLYPGNQEVDAYQLVVRYWTIKRGWIYEVMNEYHFSSKRNSGVFIVSNVKPLIEPAFRREMQS